jgi:DNA end-binding protein Ku
MGPRASWKGYLKLSLVSCAVNLYPASSSSSRISFNTINRKTGNKLKRQFVDGVTGEVVENQDQAKGFPVANDSYVLIEDEELDKIQIESNHTVEIEKFVPRSEIDPRYLESPYYIAPGERVAEEAFSIIRDAMRDEKVVGLGRVVMARRERVILLEPLGKGLLGTILRYASEVRSEDSYFENIAELKLPDDMKDLAHVIIERKAGHFDAAQFNDRYEDAIVDLVRSKQAGLPQSAPETSRPGNVVNIMDALRKSIAAVGAAEPALDKGDAKSAEAPPSASKPKAPSRARAETGSAQAAPTASTASPATRAKRAK